MINISANISSRNDFKALSPSRVNKLMRDVINKTIDEAQEAQRQHVARAFVDRQGKGLLRRLVKIGRADRPTPDNLTGRVLIVGPEGSEGAGSLLSRHEDGGQRRRPGGSAGSDPTQRVRGVFWIPTKAIRPSFAQAVPRKLYPASLHLQESRYEGTTKKGKRAGYVGARKTSGGKLVLKGSDRTFVMFGANGGRPIGVFQRSGKSKWGGKGRSGGKALGWSKVSSSWHTRDDIRLIWAFKPTITLKRKLRFYDIAPKTIRDRASANFDSIVRKMLTLDGGT